MIKIETVTGISEFLREEGERRELFKVAASGGESGKVFLVVNYGGDEKLPLAEQEQKTIEVRTDGELRKVLMEKYESVMQSRYFGRGGIEIVLTGQMSEDEINDLIRLSYNLSAQEE